MIKKAFLFPLFLIVVSCTSLNKLDYYKEVELSSIVSNGDKINVTLQNGDSHYIKVVSISEDKLVGTVLSAPDINIVSIDLSPGRGITIQVEDIEYIEVQTIDGGKTTLAIAGGIVLLPFAILGLFFGAAASGY
jgi:hypothetical protein